MRAQRQIRPMPAEELGSAPQPLMLPKSRNTGTVSGDNSAGERWYVAQSQPRAEASAIGHLERQGYNVFCPRYRKTVRHARKARHVLAPLFPNYLFLQLDTSRDPWRAVNGTRGVVRLISQGETPAPLPHGVVEGLLARTGADGVMEWMPSFKIGQAVRIAEGPFMDLVGKLEHLDAAGRVRVLLELLGRHVSVALRCEVLIAAA
jgi:transcription elongation factor/antiterminator RfaH